jgi:hypothetical protein
MKFKNYLETISGVEIYPLTSLLIFFLFFTALAIWAFRANKQYIDEQKNLPLGNDHNL